MIRHPEHYRWGAFAKCLTANRPISAAVTTSLYDLGAADLDPARGEAMMHALILLPECPAAVEERALASGIRSLARAVEKKRLLSVAAREMTPEVFQRCLDRGDAGLH